MNFVNWIPIDQEPKDKGDEFAYLITDGKEISIGWLETWYEGEESDDPFGHSDVGWHDDTHVLRATCDGWAYVTHWAHLPELPKEDQ